MRLHPHLLTVMITVGLSVPQVVTGQAPNLADRSVPAAADSVPPADGGLGSTMTLEQLGKIQREAKQKKELPKVVQPAAEPKPALKFRFWPKERDLQTGSAQLHYYRALAHYLQIPGDERQRLHDAWFAWFSENPTPGDEERAKVVDRMRNIYDELHQMALSEDSRWDHRWRELSGSSSYQYLLHDVQESRSLARLLTLKIDHHLAHGEFAAAISSLQDGYRLAFFVSQGETLVQQLVGIAISSVMRGKVEEAIQVPGCPNFYWAVAALPRPISDMRRALQIELGNLTRIFPDREAAESELHRDDYWMQRWSESIEALKELGSPRADTTFLLALAPVMFTGPAKQRLLDSGMDLERVEKMPAMQAVFLDTAIELRQLRDEMEKSSLLPYEHAYRLMQSEEREFWDWMKERKRTSAAAVLGGLLLPATTAARQAEIRDSYMHCRLMNVEALRMHAAMHGGKLPDTLAELDPVPAMHNPFTGEPFQYTVRKNGHGTVLTLDGEVPASMNTISKITLRFRDD